MPHYGNHRNVFIGSLLLSIVVCLGFAITLTLLSSATGENVREKPAKLGVVPYITSTSTLASTPTSILPTPEIIDGIQVGSVVQIFGTEGVGLKLRRLASIQAEQISVALDSEVYQVTGGPIVADDYIWWQLTSPYDTQRTGWAVSQYLTTIQ